jgi:hypothetical protein
MTLLPLILGSAALCISLVNAGILAWRDLRCYLWHRKHDRVVPPVFRAYRAKWPST